MSYRIMILMRKEFDVQMRGDFFFLSFQTVSTQALVASTLSSRGSTSWDVRQAERGGCVKRMTLCNRGQPLYTLAAGTSRGADGGGGFQISKMSGGEPFIAVGSWSVTLRISMYTVPCTLFPVHGSLFNRKTRLSSLRREHQYYEVFTVRARFSIKDERCNEISCP